MDYKAEYEDGNFEMINANYDSDALAEAYNLEKEHGTLFNLFEVDEDYNEIRTII